MAIPSDSESDTDSIPSQVEQDYTREDTEWADVEPDSGESLQYHSLGDSRVFGSLEEMLEHCKDNGLDIRGHVKDLGLDFYSSIKMVNYLRSLLAAGQKPILKDAKDWEDDKYMHPVLEDDAVLFSLDELLEPAAAESEPAAAPRGNTESQQVKDLQQQLEALQRGFAEYRAAVEETLEKRWNDRSEATAGSSSKGSIAKAEGSRAPVSSLSSAEARLPNGGRDDDTHYFDSYSYNDIHETMLKDTIRTSAYRDFIYAHKTLFAGKTVVDVGTGTGILSMFSARAGASRVLAVDNSAIITKAREIVAANSLDNVVHCVRGKVEDVELPDTSKVDVIVSEWMGYCLLYESMLDSVLRARDRFLKPDGLLAPSHMTLRVAPVADPEWVEDSIGFWGEVYGFDMRAMTEKIADDVVVRSVAKEALIAPGTTFKTLDLYTVQVGGLDFEEKFETVVERDVDGLDGWVIWFDTFFLASRGESLEDGAVAEAWPGKAREDRGVAFTTGPGGGETHWRAGFCVIDHRAKGKKLRAEEEGKEKVAKRPTPLKKGQKITGSVGYKKRESNSRELDIEISWEVEGTGERGRQVWCMR